jgi:hypothetical protein
VPGAKLLASHPQAKPRAAEGTAQRVSLATAWVVRLRQLINDEIDAIIPIVRATRSLVSDADISHL